MNEQPPAPVRTRVSEMLGIDYPIVQAPMGWIARSQLASAVCAAGALGIIETSSGELDNVRREIEAMRGLTDRPFGVNIAQAFVRDPNIVDFVVEQGVRFVTTSAGDPTKYTAQLKAAGLTDRDLARLRAPIGLDLGGKAPWEVAVATLGEIIALRSARCVAPA